MQRLSYIVLIGALVGAEPSEASAYSETGDGVTRWVELARGYQIAQGASTHRLSEAEIRSFIGELHAEFAYLDAALSSIRGNGPSFNGPLPVADFRTPLNDAMNSLLLLHWCGEDAFEESDRFGGPSPHSDVLDGCRQIAGPLHPAPLPSRLKPLYFAAYGSYSYDASWIAYHEGDPEFLALFNVDGFRPRRFGSGHIPRFFESLLGEPDGVEAKVDYLVASKDTELAVARLIELGQPALDAIVELMLSEDYAQRSDSEKHLISNIALLALGSSGDPRFRAIEIEDHWRDSFSQRLWQRRMSRLPDGSRSIQYSRAGLLQHYSGALMGSAPHPSPQPPVICIETDRSAPTIACNAPARVTPPDAPVYITATAQDACSLHSVDVVSPVCSRVNPAGHEVHPSCVPEVDGPTVTIADTGGVGATIEWTVIASDTSGNVARVVCSVTVERPGEGHGPGHGGGDHGHPPGRDDRPGHGGPDHGHGPGHGGDHGGGDHGERGDDDRERGHTD